MKPDSKVRVSRDSLFSNERESLSKKFGISILLNTTQTPSTASDFERPETQKNRKGQKELGKIIKSNHDLNKQNRKIRFEQI